MKEQAINNLHDPANKTSNDIALRLTLAQELLAASKHKEAEDAFKKILDLDENNLEAKCGLAKTCYQQREYSTALNMLEDVCQQSGTDQEYQNLYARLLIREMQVEEEQLA